MTFRRSSRGGAPLALVAVALLLQAPVHAQEAADRAYINATVYTVDDGFTMASAVAIRDGRFVYVGDEAGLEAHVGSNTLVVDLDGRTILPGLHDAHAHIPLRRAGAVSACSGHPHRAR